jgi:hypothetical protein
MTPNTDPRADAADRARQDALYADEPWAKLAVQAGFRPYDTESAARRAFAFAAKREAELVEALRFYADPDGDGYAANVTDYGLGLETGDIINDRGERARALLARIEGRDA